MCLESDAGFTQNVEERLFLACFDLSCQSAACAHLRGNRDHASGQTALREHGFCRERLLGGRKRDDRKRPFAPRHGRRMRSACICFSVMTYMLVTSPTASLSVRP